LSDQVSEPSSGRAGPTRDARGRGPGLDGILVVAKPAGPTSHDIVALVRRLTATKRVGHGGTLDPFATGVLPLFLGRATRLVEYHLGDRKAYRATICFGASSTTDDLDGELTPAKGPAPDRAAVEAALATQVGPIAQVPPAYSAIKLGGRRAYAMARAGETPVLAPRQVTIDRLELLDWDGTDPDRPIAIVEVDCSAGTYVRSLARDVGRAVGSAAYLGALVRTGSGGFQLDRAHSLEAIRAATETGSAGLVPLLLPLDTGLEALPRVTLSATEVVAVGRGQFVRPEATLPSIAPGERLIAVDGNARIVAVGGIRDGRFAPDKVLVEPPGPMAAASRA
jgi:tRNA pseudouridine55 synthase